MKRKRKHLEPMCDVQEMSVTTAETETDYEDCNNNTPAHVFPKFFLAAAHIVGFRVLLRVDLVFRVVNGVLVAVIVHSICIPNFLHISHRENGSFEVLSSNHPTVTIDRPQLYMIYL